MTYLHLWAKNYILFHGLVRHVAALLEDKSAFKLQTGIFKDLASGEIVYNILWASSNVLKTSPYLICAENGVLTRVYR